MFKAKNITKKMGGKKIVDDVSFELHRGKISVLFGPSGGGKTTLCRSLTLLERPDSGIIEIDDIQHSFPNHERDLPLFSKVNMVFQQLFLWPHLTNEENIKLAIGDLNAKKKERFEYLVELLDIADILKQYPNQSSVGQKQRVAIARVLVLEPEFVFFDEITSALDIVQINNIIQLLTRLKSESIGMLIITHNLHFIERIADEILFMVDGRIVECGVIGVLQQPKSKQLKDFLIG